jgi:hypothetical protein
VIPQGYEQAHLDSVAPRAAGQQAENDLVQGLAGPQQQAALDGPVGDLDEAAPGRDVAEVASHIL